MEMTVMKTAYEDPATRQGWRRTAVFRLCAFLLSLASFPVWLFLVIMTSVWALVVFLPVLLVLLYVAMLNVVRLWEVMSLRRILRVYPWQSCRGAAGLANNGTTRFSLPDPERPARDISVGHGDWLGSGFTFWVRAVKAEAVHEVWFAGDPRFLGVVAVPGPRRLVRVAQREALDGRMSARKRGISPEARERAKAAGARVG
ncbi:hypothetical protein ACYSUO_09340 [Streptomyces sp. UC4497]